MEYKCEYCGSEDAITRDHVIPKSYSGTESFKDSDLNPMVYCCKHCNSTLGNRALHTFEGRANYLYNKIKDKNAALLKIPDWTDADYQGMNPKFAKKIKVKEKKKKIIQQRLEHLDSVRFG
jgi:hypothetical protein